MNWLRPLQIALLAIIALVLAIYLAYSAASLLTRPPAASADYSVLFTVEPGASVAEIGGELRDEGLILSDLVFRLALERRGSGNSLQPGQFLLRSSMSMDQIIDELQRGQVSDRVVRVIEGWRSEQIADYLEAGAVFERDEFLDLVNSGSTQFQHEFLPDPGNSASLEGYLFPDTYFVGAQTTAGEFIDGMLDRFGQIYGPQERQGAVALGLSDHQVITLASIVEREAQLDEERPLIASVYLNRLAQGWPLQADPTVQYALGQTGDGSWWKSGLTISDLGIPSPYNSYVNQGLPPGPIANPGAASIRAVLEPAQTDFMFFVARGDGSHAFAESAEEHQQNVNRFQSG